MSTEISIIVNRDSGEARELEVHEMNILEATRATRNSEMAAKTPTGDDVADNLRVFFYPFLCGSTSGLAVPTEAEFLHMPRAEANKWFVAVDKENPGIFPQLAVLEPDEKKEP